MIAAAVGLLASCLAVAVPAAAEPSALAVPTLDWGTCGEQYPGFECAVAKVPLDYDRPNGPTTQIALTRKPATDKANRIGSVFLNPGGPGGSGVAYALRAGDRLSQALNGRFDIVGFDPRGVGGSDPLHCFKSQDDQNAFFAGLPGFPYQRDQERPYFDRYRSLSETCHQNDGTIARHMSTADVVRDLDLLRRAVGDRKLTYLGFSYGSFLGNTYANMFPDNIRALVIDGVLDPRLWSSGSQIKSDRVATAEEFDELLRLCDEAGPDCAFATPQGSAARWEALAESVRATPVDLGGGNLYTYDLLIGDAVGAMYSPEGWGGPDGYGAFVDSIADAALGGDQAAAARAAALRPAFIAKWTASPSKETQGKETQGKETQGKETQGKETQGKEADYPNGFDSYNGNVCADIRFPARFEAYRAIGQYAEAGSRFGPLWWWSNSACADWPVNEDRYTGPWRTRTSSPVLVVGNYFDGVTDYRGAQASANLLQGSRLLSYAGWGHTAYSRSTCVNSYVNSYLLTGALPAEGTVCPANPNPFLPRALRAEEPQAGLPTTWPARG